MSNNLMKNKIFLLLMGSMFLFSCTQKENTVAGYFVESQPSFYQLKHGDWTDNTWVRQPKNLMMIHETFKKIGYEKIIGDQLDVQPFILQDLYINKSPRDLIDSLVLTYDQPALDIKYYREFWLRRQEEKNDSVVYQILREIQTTYQPDVLVTEVQEDLVNDTLYHLLKIEYNPLPLTNEIARENFKKLAEMKFHGSAYHLLFEREEYAAIEWEKEVLRKQLQITEKKVDPWFEDNVK